MEVGCDYCDIRRWLNTFTFSQRQIHFVGAQAIDILVLRGIVHTVQVFTVFIFVTSETQLFSAILFPAAQVMMCLSVNHIRYTNRLIDSDLQTSTSDIKLFISVLLSMSPRMEKWPLRCFIINLFSFHFIILLSTMKAFSKSFKNHMGCSVMSLY